MHNTSGGVLYTFTKMIKYIISRKATLKFIESPERLWAFLPTGDMPKHFLLTYL